MAAGIGSVWRIRPGGSNNNGGGYNPFIPTSGAATGTHGSWTTSGGVTTFTDATAAAFTSGMTNSSIFINGVGTFKATFVSSTQITIQTMPPWLPQNSGGGNYNWTIGSGIDYSQQDAAQLTQSNPANTSTSTTTLTDTGASFTAALIGNAIRVAGTGITTTYTFINAVPSSTTLTLQTSPGTTGTSVSYNIGGAWADHANAASTGFVVPGNTIYFLGGASPSYGSPDYSLTFITPPNGNATAGYVTFEGDPATPTTNGFGGYPLIKTITSGTFLYNSVYVAAKNLFGFAGIANSHGFIGPATSNGSNFPAKIKNVVFDQNGYDMGLLSNTDGSAFLLNCEVFSSAAKRTTNANYGIGAGQYTARTVGCNVHDTIGPGVIVDVSGSIMDTIIAKSGADSLTIGSNSSVSTQVKNCTIDGGAGHGVVVQTQAALASLEMVNCIISNHTTAGKFAITVSAGTQATNDQVKGIVDYQTLYNNAGNYNAISPGAHDTVLSSDPYVGQSTQDYTLA